jgi:hypothetical protein
MRATCEWEFVCDMSRDCDSQTTFRMKVETGWLYLHEVFGGGDGLHCQIAVAMAFVRFGPRPLVRAKKDRRRVRRRPRDRRSSVVSRAMN